MKIKYLLSSVAGIAVLAVATGAHAQAANAESNSGGLSEIIVTAQKRSENLQRTAIAITALSSEKLDQQGSTNIADISQSLPNVVIGSAASLGSAGASFFIRGVGLDRSTLAQEAGVGLYIDDIYYGRSPGGLLSLLDVKSIEVLRGPQGTLFGKNTIGGAIRYVTNDPSFDNSGFVDVKVGQRQHLDVRGSVNLAVSDQLALKFSAGSFNSGGFVNNITTGLKVGDEHTNVARIAALWKPTDRLTVKISADYTSSHNNGPALSVSEINPASAIPALWNTLHPDNPYDNRYASTLYVGRAQTTPFQLEGFGVTANIAYELNDHLTIKSISGYRKNNVRYSTDYDGSPVPIYTFQFDDKLPSFSTELQLIGDAMNNRLQYLLGVYYFSETPRGSAESKFFLFPNGSVQINKLNSKSYAIFGQATIELIDNLKLTVGGRYTEDKKVQVITDAPRGLAGSSSDKWSNFSPKAALQYQFTPDVMAYISASKGYRSGGLNAAGTGAVIPFDPETAWSYEAGLKTELLNNRLRVNASVFQLDYKNLQLTTPKGQPAVLTVGNAGKSRVKGVELDAVFVPVDGLTLEGSFGHLDAKYLEAPASSGVTPGSVLAGAPKYSYSLGATYKQGLDGHGSISFHADYGYKTGVKTYASDLVSVILPSLGLLNAEIRYTTEDEKTSFAVQGRNITNEKYAENALNFTAPASVNPGLIGDRLLTVGRPSEFYFTMKRKF